MSTAIADYRSHPLAQALIGCLERRAGQLVLGPRATAVIASTRGFSHAAVPKAVQALIELAYWLEAKQSAQEAAHRVLELAAALALRIAPPSAPPRRAKERDKAAMLTAPTGDGIRIGARRTNHG